MTQNGSASYPFPVSAPPDRVRSCTRLLPSSGITACIYPAVPQEFDPAMGHDTKVGFAYARRERMLNDRVWWITVRQVSGMALRPIFPCFQNYQGPRWKLLPCARRPTPFDASKNC